jgi:hypothetical protein
MPVNTLQTGGIFGGAGLGGTSTFNQSSWSNP